MKELGYYVHILIHQPIHGCLVVADSDLVMAILVYLVKIIISIHSYNMECKEQIIQTFGVTEK